MYVERILFFFLGWITSYDAVCQQSWTRIAFGRLLPLCRALLDVNDNAQGFPKFALWTVGHMFYDYSTACVGIPMSFRYMIFNTTSNFHNQHL